ncbi:MAG: hypothetical protein IH840_06785 [Candidatus Heimdallarchaeota archaeon]|nr:hypothetical protein [Candidatus Heimdallarchaeota archaeon]
MGSASSKFDLPIQNIFILDGAGIPVFMRDYSEILLTNETDSVLLAGFITAIDIFSRSSLKGKLNDIGLDEKRFFFSKSHGDYIFVISTTSPNKNVIEELLVKIVNHLQNTLTIAITLIESVALVNNLQIRELILDFGQTIDTWVLESSLEFSDIELNYEEEGLKLKDRVNQTKFDSVEFQRMIKSIEDKTRNYLDKLSNI